ncbi:MAG: response regulator [Magnetococcales bacterium]|nr:response regulator [Magnetococcales bacterium]
MMTSLLEQSHLGVWLLGLLGMAVAGGFAWRSWRARLQREQSLLERETRLRLMFEHALDGVIVIDGRGIVQDLNPAASAMFGYAREQMLGRDLVDLIIPLEFREAHKAALRRRVRSESAQGDFRRKVDLQGQCADGRRIDLEAGLFDVRLAGKTCYAAFLHDVTQKKQLLRSLEETLAVAESAHRAKSEFLANMSHEIRTPMNTIIGMTDLILTMPLAPEEWRQNLEIIQRSSQSLLELINSILDFSKIEARMILLERVAFDLAGQVEQACDSLAVKAHQKHLELSCRLAPDLPATLIGDPLRLERILINLLNNAIKFTEVGEVVLDVVLADPAAVQGRDASCERPVWLHFAVRDTGVGIAPEKQELIFERFTQADGSVTRKHGGTGLGLTISRHLATLMGGELRLESVPGSGSTFHALLPFGQEQGPAPVMELPRGVRVLVGDPHASGRGIVTGILTLAGAVVVEAGDPDAWRERLRESRVGQTPFALLLLDHAMLAGRVFADPETAGHPCVLDGRVVLLLPRHVTVEEVKRGEGVPEFCPVRKPVWRDSLLCAIRRLLGQRCQEDPAVVSGPVTRSEGGLDILVAEDEPDHRHLASAILTRAGHTVTLAGNGLEAIEAWRRRPFDLILMDLRMPGLDGIEATRRIRASDSAGLANPGVPVIALTGKIMNREEQQCLEVGMDACLSKPYHPAELLDMIRMVIRRRRSSRQPAAPGEGMAVLREVEDGGDLHVRRMAFLDLCPALLDGLRVAVACRDRHEARRIAVMLCDKAREIGATPLAVQGLRLRGCVEQKKWEKADEALTRLVMRCDATRQAIGKVTPAV